MKGLGERVLAGGAGQLAQSLLHFVVKHHVALEQQRDDRLDRARMTLLKKNAPNMLPIHTRYGDDIARYKSDLAELNKLGIAATQIMDEAKAELQGFRQLSKGS